MGWRRGQALGQDLRDRVLAAEGSAVVVAARFGVSPSYVIKARQRRDRLGDTGPGAQRSHTVAKLGGHDQALRAELTLRPDATLAELQAWAKTFDISVSLAAISTRLKWLGLTLKKRRSPPRSSSARISLPRAVLGAS